jgi:DUF2075 family protein
MVCAIVNSIMGVLGYANNIIGVEQGISIILKVFYREDIEMMDDYSTSDRIVLMGKVKATITKNDIASKLCPFF